MKFGIHLPQFGRAASPESLVRMAKAAESQDFDSVWCSDHVVIPDPYVERFSERFYEIFTTLAFVAAHTERVRLGTSVLLLAYRHPVMTAKMVASLDQLSHGRVVLGVAPGWMAEEYAILDLPYAGRGRRADEALEAIQQMWASAHPSFAGEHYRFSGFAFAPPPAQRPRPPIWIGGNNDIALRRVVRFGDGWHPITSVRIGIGLDELAKKIETLRGLAAEAGRDPRSIAVSLRAPLSFGQAAASRADHLSFVGPPSEIAALLRRCAAIGVDHVLFDCIYSFPERLRSDSVDACLEAMERFTREVRPAL